MKEQFGIADLSAPISDEHKKQLVSMRDTLCKIITFCKERNFKPVIVMPPIYHALWQQFPKSFWSNYVEPLVKEIDATVCDYMKETEFDKKEFFDNALFMSDKGAKQFTLRVLRDVGLI